MNETLVTREPSDPPRRREAVVIRNRPVSRKRPDPNPNSAATAGMFDLIRPVFRVGLGHITLFAALGLVLIGVLAIDTAPKPSFLGGAAVKQAVFAAIGLLVMTAVAAPHYRRIGDYAYPILVAVMVMLVIVLLPVMPQSIVPVRNGARRWIDLGFVIFQPSELAKLAFVLALARYLRFRENYRTIRGLLMPAVLTAIPMGLIMVEPDLGTSLLFPPILAAMLLAAGAKIRHMLAIAGLGLLAIALVLVVELVIFPTTPTLLRPHQKDRIVAMLDTMQGETRHRQSTGFQGYTASTTAGAGQVAGYGREGAQTILKFNRLPEAHNDMIFAVVCARWGTLGGLTVIGLYLVFLASALLVAAVHKDPFARLVIVGLCAITFSQVFINIGMTIGLLPITGMTLPMVSYGGSSLLVNFAVIGMVLNIAARPAKMLTRPSFEFNAESEE